ncbi:MAG: WYL domain-containing protein [Firmicutes bacterium]|nr:WYL domain-containing protein [Bacillota bacterium]
MDDTKKYDLLGKIIALILSDEYKATISNLSQDLKLPIEYVRRTILTLFKNNVLRSCLRDDSDDNTFNKKLRDDPQRTEEELISGVYDNTLWVGDVNGVNTNEVILSLLPMEYGFLKSINEDILSLKKKAAFEIKDSKPPLSPKLKLLSSKIQEAINGKKKINFGYTQKDSTTGKDSYILVTCLPHKIITNLFDNWLYLMSSDLNLYRLDRIKDGYIRKLTEKSPSNTETDPKEKYIWGAYVAKDEKPQHVKLKIYNETSNIISKIKQDTALRSKTCKLYEENGDYYYEDDIIDINQFQRWLRSYGSSITVIEPENLRNVIIEKAKEALELYEKSGSWGDL